MSSTYLDRFRSSLPTVQGNQILRILTKKRDSGEIKNVDEFKARLKALTTKLISERITPTLELFDALEGVTTSSEQFNDMLEHIEDDLAAAFAEADTIDEVITAHHNLINEVSLKALRFGVNELDAKITLYEFINSNTEGFDDALFNTFREASSLTTSRSDPSASLVYIDPVKLEEIPVDEDAEVDYVGERLILGSQKKKYLNVREAEWTASENSIRGELQVSFPNSKISNITDNKINTFWVEPILLSEIRTAGVPMEVVLNMNSSQDINFVEIEPAADFPMILTGIDYYDASNTRQSLNISSSKLNGPTRINFSKITTRSLVIKVRQDNYKEVQFTSKLGSSQFHRAVLGENSNTVDMASISEELKDLLSSEFIMNDIMGLSAYSTGSVKKYYQYLLGFDNIRAGFSLFDERSVFVSKKKTVDKLGQLALRVDEVRPMISQGSSVVELEDFDYPAPSTEQNNKFYHGSLEYYAVVQFYTDDDFLISTDTIPLLPLGAKRIYHERMIFIATSTGATVADVAQLRFFTAADSDDVNVYRNGTLLTYGAAEDWSFVDPLDTTLGDYTITTSGSGKPMKRAIKINNTVNTLDIYTVSYTPTVSNTKIIPISSATLMNTVDLLGDKSARMTKDNVVVFGETRLVQSVDHADVYFLTVLRRNSAKESLSPALEEFMLAITSRNSDKFLGD